MSGYSLWELDIRELIRDFTEEDLSAASVEAFWKGMGLGEVNVSSGPMSAEKMLMVYSNSDYSFTSDDINWLSTASKVISCENENGLQLYFIEMLCDEEDYYIPCAAQIKLFNVVFPGKNIFIFKLNTGIAFGSARDLEGSFENNFCVSALISVVNSPQYSALIDELQFADVNDIPAVIIHYSPQEETNVPTSYDDVKRVIDPDYLCFLDEVEAFFGESAENEREHYLSGNDSVQRIAESYRDACKQLSRTAKRDDHTSYDELEKAEEAEEKAARYVFTVDSGQLTEEDRGLSDEAYLDAEVMLKELLNHDET